MKLHGMAAFNQKMRVQDLHRGKALRKRRWQYRPGPYPLLLISYVKYILRLHGNSLYTMIYRSTVFVPPSLARHNVEKLAAGLALGTSRHDSMSRSGQ